VTVNLSSPHDKTTSGKNKIKKAFFMVEGFRRNEGIVHNENYGIKNNNIRDASQ